MTGPAAAAEPGLAALAGLPVTCLAMELVALPAGPDLLPVTDLGCDFSLTAGSDSPYLGRSVEPPPFRPSSVLAAGTHLHWLLPADLTHGRVVYSAPAEPGGVAASADSRAELATALVEQGLAPEDARRVADSAASRTSYPAVPDRWVVTRSAPGAAARSWVVESDLLWDGEVDDADPCRAANEQSGTVPWLPADLATLRSGTVLHRSLGRMFPAETWTETPAPRLRPLTALGYGHPAFAASLPHCYNVFGALDAVTAQEVPGRSVAYVVVGWWSDPAEDPGGPTTRTVLRGQVTGVPIVERTPDPTGQARPRVALGANTEQAVAAMLASGVPHASKAAAAESYLELLQLGLPARLDDQRPGALQDCDDALERAEFGVVPGGTHWTLVGAQDGDPPLPLPVEALDALNDAQARLDRATREVARRQDRLGADWHTYLGIAVPFRPTREELMRDDGRRNTARARLVDDIASVRAAQSHLASFTAQRDDAAAALGHAAHPLVPQAVPAAPFWHPVDPVVLLSGTAVRPAPPATLAEPTARTFAAARRLGRGAAYAEPWRPVSMHWEAAYAPAGTGEPGVAVCGATTLHAAPLRALEKKVDGFRGGPADAQSQTLSGFTAALLGRRQGVELRVLDPHARDLSEFRLGLAVADALAGSSPDGVPAEPSFAPWREGAVELRRLWVIDSFGRHLPVLDPDLSPPARRVQVAAAMRRRGVKGGHLEPRIVPPARLAARWLPGTTPDPLTDPVSDTTRSPVIGWVLLDRVDNALAVYDAAGAALGSLATHGALWQGVPGARLEDDWSTTIAPGPLHEWVGALVAAIGTDPHRPYLTALLDAIDLACEAVLPVSHAQHPGLALLVGRPLALVRASVGLELARPALDPRLDALMTPAGQPRPDGGLGSRSVSVTVGRPNHLDDGLVGYFLDRAEHGDRAAAPGASAFFCSTSEARWRPSSRPGVYRPDPARTAVSATGADLRLTLLVDPRSPVHFETDPLPVTVTRVAAEHYATVLQQLNLILPVGPILSPSDTTAGIRLPTALEPGFTWAFALQDDETTASRLPTGPVRDVATALAARHQAYDGWLVLEPRAEGAGQ